VQKSTGRLAKAYFHIFAQTVGAFSKRHSPRGYSTLFRQACIAYFLDVLSL
jgi:hypothetical protein